MKDLQIRRPDVCVRCAAELPVGSRAGGDAATGTVSCRSCALPPPGSAASPEPGAPAADPGAAGPGVGGASAQREYDRRSAGREQRIRTAHPRIGGLVLALTDDPSQTRVWAQGAAGERAVAEVLDGLDARGVLALHDRALRRPDGRLSRANLDHLAVTPAGVWVVDAKTHRGDLAVRRSGGLFRPRVEKLVIRGRDQTKLVDGVVDQVSAVARELSAAGIEVPVRGALCFVGTGMPWTGDDAVGGVAVVGRRGLAKLLRRPGPLQSGARREIADLLARRFPAAMR